MDFNNTMQIAYLVNQYPKVSHSFIRREILALEAHGLVVHRIALRGWADAVTDAEDRRERTRTRYLLQRGLLGLIAPVLSCALRSPWAFCKALWSALRLSHKADRPWPLHLVYLAEACQLVQWLREAGVEHLHAHFGTNSTEVALLANTLGGPGYSFTVHGPEEFDKPEALHLKEKIGMARFVVAISSYGRSQLYRWVDHLQWPKIQVVHCGLEAAFHQVQASSPPDVQRLVCVGRLCEQKGQLLLIKALALLAQRGTLCDLVLAGDGEMRPDVEALVAQYGLQSQVRITGWISSSQVRDEILTARGMVLPSFAEGLPVVIMEAMALRRPVLSTAIAGIPELVRHGETGWLFAAGSVDELASAIADCMTTPIYQLEEMGAWLTKGCCNVTRSTPRLQNLN
jgi:colanic acid/amylovoran biosynthesis glycosyltransferase